MERRRLARGHIPRQSFRKLGLSIRYLNPAQDAFHYTTLTFFT